MHVEWKALFRWVWFVLGFLGGGGMSTLVGWAVKVTSSYDDGWIGIAQIT